MTKLIRRATSLVIASTLAGGMLVASSGLLANTEKTETTSAEPASFTDSQPQEGTHARERSDGASDKKTDPLAVGEQQMGRESPYVKFAKQRAEQQEPKPEHVPNLSITVGRPGIGHHQQH